MKSSDVIAFYELLTAKNINVWLDGGWGVDALLERQTREHADLDIVVEQKDVYGVCELLQLNGFKGVKRDGSTPWNFVLGDQYGRLIDIHSVRFDIGGNGIYGYTERGVMYPAESFNGVGMIDNIPVKCLTAIYQVQSHIGYEIDENDINDVSELCRRFNIQYPEEYKSFNKRSSP